MEKKSPVRYGMQIRLTHSSTDRRLMSLDRRYTNLDSSKQQMVVASITNDANTLWLVKGSYEARDLPASTKAVRRGDTIRLEHVATKMNLHSHGDRNAPIDKSQQEVTAWLQHGVGDNNDNWLVEPRTGDLWLSDEPIRLVHQKTSKNLHSHDNTDPLLTAGFQEVTCFGGRDDNDLWISRSSDRLVSLKSVGGAAAKELQPSSSESKSITERFKEHPVIALLLLCVAVATGTWAFCKSTLIEIAEQKVILAERRLEDEKTTGERLKERIVTLQTDFAEKEKLFNGMGGNPSDAGFYQAKQEKSELMDARKELSIMRERTAKAEQEKNRIAVKLEDELKAAQSAADISMIEKARLNDEKLALIAEKGKLLEALKVNGVSKAIKESYLNEEVISPGQVFIDKLTGVAIVVDVEPSYRNNMGLSGSITFPDGTTKMFSLVSSGTAWPFLWNRRNFIVAASSSTKMFETEARKEIRYTVRETTQN